MIVMVGQFNCSVFMVYFCIFLEGDGRGGRAQW